MNINFNEALFHGIDKVKHPNDANKLEILEDILKTGAILSRDQQKWSLGEDITSKRIKKYKHCTNWNGDQYVSVCKKRSSKAFNKNSDSYERFVNDSIGIILSRKVLRLEQPILGCLQDGEYQIVNKIPKDFFLGISVNCSNLENYIDFMEKIGYSPKQIYLEIAKEYQNSKLRHIENILKKYNYNLPIFTTSGEQLKPGEKLLKELKDKAFQSDFGKA